MFVYVDRNGEFVTSTHRFDLRYKPNSGRNDAPPRELRFVCESSRLSAVVNSLILLRDQVKEIGLLGRSE